MSAPYASQPARATTTIAQIDRRSDTPLIAPTRVKNPGLTLSDVEPFAPCSVCAKLRGSPSEGAVSTVLPAVAGLDAVPADGLASNDATGDAGRIARRSGPHAESAGTRRSIDSVTSHTRCRAPAEARCIARVIPSPAIKMSVAFASSTSIERFVLDRSATLETSADMVDAI